jgi:hypothetical protein
MDERYPAFENAVTQFREFLAIQRWPPVSARLGVMLEAVCRGNERTFARVVRPVDEDASSRGLFPDGLKLSALESPLSATIAYGLREAKPRLSNMTAA